MKRLAIFTTISYPTNSDFFEILEVLDQQKIEFVEIGLPVANPFLDGELIQKTHQEVLESNPLSFETLTEILTTVKERFSFKVILMTYKEGKENYKLDQLDQTLYEGIICVDDSPAEGNLKGPVHLFTTESSTQEMLSWLKEDSPFAYVVSTPGKTGQITQISEEYVKIIKFIHEHSSIPAFVGFGIKDGNDVDKVIANGADGAIIGTEFIKTYEQTGIEGVHNYLKELQK